MLSLIGAPKGDTVREDEYYMMMTLKVISISFKS